MTPALILRDLDRLLAGMSPRTRRPIRFLAPDGRKAEPRPEPDEASELRSSGAPSGASSAPRSSRPDASAPPDRHDGLIPER